MNGTFVSMKNYTPKTRSETEFFERSFRHIGLSGPIEQRRRDCEACTTSAGLTVLEVHCHERACLDITDVDGSASGAELGSVVFTSHYLVLDVDEELYHDPRKSAHYSQTRAIFA